MERTLIKNVGTLVTGDIGSPLAEADAILIEGSHISYVGMTGNLESSEYERVIDAAGMTLLPGLIDSHIHPAIGEYTPMQNMIGYIGSYLHGGTTTMISNGEVLLPGQPDYTPVPAIAIGTYIVYRRHVYITVTAVVFSYRQPGFQRN